MYVPNLAPLVDAHFACDDDWESDLIVQLMESFKNESPWPRKVYAEGLKESGLSEYTYKALGEVCDDYYDNMGCGINRRKKLEFPSPPQSPPPTDVGPLLAAHRAGKQVQEAVECGEAGVGGKQSAGGSRRGKGKRKAKPKHRRLRFAIENPPPIVCALKSPYEWPNYEGGPQLKGKGKEKVGVETKDEETEDEEVPLHKPRNPSLSEITSSFVTSDSDNHSDKSYDLYLEESGSDYDWSVVRVTRRWIPKAGSESDSQSEFDSD